MMYERFVNGNSNDNVLLIFENASGVHVSAEARRGGGFPWLFA